MLAAVKERNTDWIIPYPKIKDEELQSFRYTVENDGCWGIGKDGHTYYAGKVEDVKKGSAVPPQFFALSPVVEKKAVTPRPAMKPIAPANVTAQNGIEKKMVELSEKGYTTREIAKQIGGISHMTVARRLKGQRSLF